MASDWPRQVAPTNRPKENYEGRRHALASARRQHRDLRRFSTGFALVVAEPRRVAGALCD